MTAGFYRMSTPILQESIEHDSWGLDFDSPTNSVLWSHNSLFDRNTWERDNYGGQLDAAEWLHEVSAMYLMDPLPPMGATWGNFLPAATLAKSFYSVFHRDFASLFLDSFSVIENGETARRYDREISTSVMQRAVLKIAREKRGALLDAIGPREFEVVVAYALKDAGFDKVVLRRYSKDDGSDIVAITSSGQGQDTVLVEVKHQRKPTGLVVLDRLNGARDRREAAKALLVTSGHVTRDGNASYAAKRDIVAAYSFTELLAFLDDQEDWNKSPTGLWTKAIK